MDTSKDGMTDIVERLRVTLRDADDVYTDVGSDAADEIESLRQQLAEKDAGLESATLIINQHVAEIGKLTQQLAEFEEDHQRKKDHIAHFRRQLAESQAREKMLQEMVGRWLGDEGWGQADMDAYDDLCASDSTALDACIKQGQREVLLEAAGEIEFYSSTAADDLRRMAEELKTTDVEQTNKG